MEHFMITSLQKNKKMASQTITKQVSLKASSTLLEIDSDFPEKLPMKEISTISIGDHLDRISQILVIGTLGTIISPNEIKRPTSTISHHYDYSNGYQSRTNEDAYQAVLKFAENLIGKSKSIEPEIQKSIQKRFWDLI